MKSLICLILVGKVLFLHAEVQKCRPHCVDCSELTGDCLTCDPGRWGASCNKLCSDPNCLLNTCNKHTGKCTFGCQDGWFLERDTCVPCSSDCLQCRDRTHCFKCKGAKFGGKCDRNCGILCKTCIQKYNEESFGRLFQSTCLECEDGVYGPRTGCYYDCNFCDQGICSRYNCTYGCKEGYHNFESRVCVRCFPGCETCNAFSWKDKTCLTCPKGKWGSLCDHDCSNSCDHGICDQTNGNCSCHEGYFVNATGLCDKCPHNCLGCSSFDNCTKCKDGMYGKTCESICHSSCLKCEGDRDTCSECPSDHFQRDSRCFPCDEGCSACWWMKFSRISECTRCKEGYYREQIEGRTITKCYKCPTGCSSCNRLGECDGCSQGYNLFLRTCCPDTCEACLTAEQCTSCVDGYYGPSCQYKCRDTCTKCPNSRYCYTCKPGYYSNPEDVGFGCECSLNECVAGSNGSNGSCQACKQAGWYVKENGCCQCNKCANNDCDSQGKCVSGCPGKHKFGLFCDLDCSEAVSGCLECVGDYRTTVQCQKCYPTKYLYGNICHQCSENCLNSICDNDGSCKKGCKEGWMGKFCDEECGERCKFDCRQYDCPRCQDGFYGDRCEYQCNENCDVNIRHVSVCNKKGACMSCRSGLWGGTCSKACNPGCKEEICDRRSGFCVGGCRPGLHGEFCDHQITNAGTESDGLTGQGRKLLGDLLVVAFGTIVAWHRP